MKSTRFKLRESQNTTGHRRLIIGFFVVLVIFTVTLLVFTRNEEGGNRDDDTQIYSAKDKIADSKDTRENNSVNLPDSSSSITSGQVATSEDIVLTITETNQSNGSVNATALVQGSSSDGTCVFSYSSEDKPVVKQVASSENKCSSSIPEVEFSKLGEWNLNVTYYNRNQKAEANRSVEIK
jgi:hypothetical protein